MRNLNEKSSFSKDSCINKTLYRIDYVCSYVYSLLSKLLNTMLYIGIGVGVLVLLLIVVSRFKKKK